ncbi:zf-HC2 domain-containing protein [Gracilibacillus salinarum]|uniref:Zf-HC2 domain-containing protein n=1 Tax=Gracilibacillus salinarum TaxID=2932255 RepID=A0ABY4GK18_9BACI|nr:zf-HC2 domain-containing protein [Gracilibacillus salinarum]UOQ84700.1 zf-HC2 domain-containing protein [Gracilibacillus salinarum]
MNKCEIVKDLIPMYVEKLTSEDSNQFIEEHLHSCEECSRFLKNAEGDLPRDEFLDDEPDDRKLIKGVKRRINHMIIIAVLIGIVIGLVISLRIFSFWLVAIVTFLLFIYFLIYFMNRYYELKNKKEGKK